MQPEISIKYHILTTFKQLGLSDNILKVLNELGFEKPTDIQAQAIPHLISGHRDLIGLAQTGTGKTAAFGLPLLENINPADPKVQALILAPTRELGKQIAEQLAIFSKYMKQVNVLAVYGGAPIVNQIKALKKPQQIIIATPGRLIDLIKRKAIFLDELQILVLDEADEMLNMGFKDDLDTILSYSPEEKMTWLFSATMPNAIKGIVAEYMTDPIEVKVNTKNEVNANIKHVFTTVSRANKQEALTRFLDMDQSMRGVVFCRTRRDTQELAEHLMQRGYLADSLHGDLSQAQRDRVMKRFKNRALQVLVATDVAARGIDVNDLTHVFHYTLPDETAYYTHRSGRTARAGKSGVSISFINGRESYRINRLERDLGIKFEKITVPNTSDIKKVRLDNWSSQISATDASGIDKSNLADIVKKSFDSLSKDDLIHKLVAHQLDNMNLDELGSLNDNADYGSDRGDRGRGRGGRDRGGRGSRGGSKSRFKRSGGGRRGSSRSNDKPSSDSGSGRSRRKSSKDKKKKYFSK